jgi:hypothetical protein
MSRTLRAVAFGVVAGVVGAGNGLTSQDLLMSRTETAKRVIRDLAERLKVPQEQIELVKESDQTWPDANLGCPGRKPLAEPRATPGFAFTLFHQGRQFVYHSDRRGQFKRCTVPKAIGPISAH